MHLITDPHCAQDFNQPRGLNWAKPDPYLSKHSPLLKEGCDVDPFLCECNWGDIRRADSARKVGEQDEAVTSVM